MTDKTKAGGSTRAGGTKNGPSRRAVLKSGAAASGALLGLGAVTGFPTIWAQNIKDVVLRQFGTGISAQPAIMDKVKADLGFSVQMAGLDSNGIIQRAITQPDSYEIADIEFWIAKKVFAAGNMQPVDTRKIKLYSKIVLIFTTGKLTPELEDRSGHAAAYGRLYDRTQ